MALTLACCGGFPQVAAGQLLLTTSSAPSGGFPFQDPEEMMQGACSRGSLPDCTPVRRRPGVEETRPDFADPRRRSASQPNLPSWPPTWRTSCGLPSRCRTCLTTCLGPRCRYDCRLPSTAPGAACGANPALTLPSSALSLNATAFERPVPADGCGGVGFGRADSARVLPASPRLAPAHAAHPPRLHPRGRGQDAYAPAGRPVPVRQAGPRPLRRRHQGRRQHAQGRPVPAQAGRRGAGRVPPAPPPLPGGRVRRRHPAVLPQRAARPQPPAHLPGAPRQAAVPLLRRLLWRASLRGTSSCLCLPPIEDR